MTRVSDREYVCKVCDYTSSTLRGIEIHVSKKAKKEEGYGKTRMSIFNPTVIPFRHQFNF